MSGLTRRCYGYNPLNDSKPLLDDVWVCVKETVFRASPSMTSPEIPYNLEADSDGKHLIDTIEPGTEVFGKREGDWIKLNDCKLYLQVKNDSLGERYFKNKKVILWEEEVSGGNKLARRPSNMSIGSSMQPKKSVCTQQCTIQ